MTRERMLMLREIARVTVDLGDVNLTERERAVLLEARRQMEVDVAPLDDVALRVIDQELYDIRTGVAS